MQGWNVIGAIGSGADALQNLMLHVVADAGPHRAPQRVEKSGAKERVVLCRNDAAGQAGKLILLHGAKLGHAQRPFLIEEAQIEAQRTGNVEVGLWIFPGNQFAGGRFAGLAGGARCHAGQKNDYRCFEGPTRGKTVTGERKSRIHGFDLLQSRTPDLGTQGDGGPRGIGPQYSARKPGTVTHFWKD